MNQPCSLLSLATAVPPYVVEQGEAKARAREAFGGRKALFDRLSGVFDNTGIARRHIVVPPDWYMHHHGWHDRNAVYLEAAENLFVDAATAAIEKAGLAPDQIDGVVTAIRRSNGSTDGATLAATLQKFKGVPTLSGKVSFSPKLHSVFGRQYRVIKINNNKARLVGTVVAKVVVKI